jgi:hypothetical protein
MMFLSVAVVCCGFAALKVGWPTVKVLGVGVQRVVGVQQVYVNTAVRYFIQVALLTLCDLL